jgi:hypothetical protein
VNNIAAAYLLAQQQGRGNPAAAAATAGSQIPAGNAMEAAMRAAAGNRSEVPRQGAAVGLAGGTLVTPNFGAMAAAGGMHNASPPSGTSTVSANAGGGATTNWRGQPQRDDDGARPGLT